MKKIIMLICACLVFITIESPIGSANTEIGSGVKLGKVATEPLVMSIASGYSSITVQIKDIDKACNLLGLAKAEVINGKKQIAVTDGKTETAFQMVKIPGLSFTVLQARWISETVHLAAEVNALMVLVKSEKTTSPTGTDKPDPDSKDEPVVDESRFRDLSGHWAEREINVLYQKMIVNGDPQGYFHPNEQITRAEFAALLVRALGIEPTTKIQGRFGDVYADRWYFNVINTATDAGLLSGYSPTTFGPEDPITREQIAVMINRALANKGKSIELDKAPISGLEVFEDRQQISSWAIDSVAAVVQQEIFKGRSSVQFVPQDNANRAEAAVIVLRMYNK